MISLWLYSKKIDYIFIHIFVSCVINENQKLFFVEVVKFFLYSLANSNNTTNKFLKDFIEIESFQVELAFL